MKFQLKRREKRRRRDSMESGETYSDDREMTEESNGSWRLPIAVASTRPPQPRPAIPPPAMQPPKAYNPVVVPKEKTTTMASCHGKERKRADNILMVAAFVVYGISVCPQYLHTYLGQSAWEAGHKPYYLIASVLETTVCWALGVTLSLSIIAKRRRKFLLISTALSITRLLILASYVVLERTKYMQYFQDSLSPTAKYFGVIVIAMGSGTLLFLLLLLAMIKRAKRKIKNQSLQVPGLDDKKKGKAAEPDPTVTLEATPNPAAPSIDEGKGPSAKDRINEYSSAKNESDTSPVPANTDAPKQNEMGSSEVEDSPENKEAE